MKSKTGKSTVASAWGKKIPAIPFEFQYDVYVDYPELEQAKDFLSNDEVVKVRNAQRKNNARSKKQTEILLAAGYVKPTLEDDDQLRLTEMFKVLMSSKLPDGSKRYTEEAARELASTTLGVDWAEDDE